MVTIGTMVFRGIAYIVLGDQAIGAYPSSFEYFGQGYVFSYFSFEFVFFSVMAVIFYVVLQKSNIGRRIYSIG